MVILFCGNNLGLDPVRLQLFFFVLSNTINMDGSEKNFIEEQTEVSAVSNAGSTNGSKRGGRGARGGTTGGKASGGKGGSKKNN